MFLEQRLQFLTGHSLPSASDEGHEALYQWPAEVTLNPLKHLVEQFRNGVRQAGNPLPHLFIYREDPHFLQSHQDIEWMTCLNLVVEGIPYPVSGKIFADFP